MAALGTTLIEDVSVPRSALPAMFDEIARIEREYGIEIPTVAHAGDGNLHPNFIIDGPEIPEHHLAAPPTSCSARRSGSAARSPASTASGC